MEVVAVQMTMPPHLGGMCIGLGIFWIIVFAIHRWFNPWPDASRGANWRVLSLVISLVFGSVVLMAVSLTAGPVVGLFVAGGSTLFYGGVLWVMLRPLIHDPRKRKPKPKRKWGFKRKKMIDGG